MPEHFDEIPSLGEMLIKHDLLRLRSILVYQVEKLQRLGLVKISRKEITIYNIDKLSDF